MEIVKDQGVVLSVRAHGENGGIVNVLSEENGKYAGYVRGIHSSKNRGVLELGNLVEFEWKSRESHGLGEFQLDLQRSYATAVMQDANRLAALQSACALCLEALPEREAHTGLFHGMVALFDAVESEYWCAAYILWELSFLRELGFSLDLSRCVGGGDTENLAYVSPKTGRAVSYDAGEPYKDKLLDLPGFLKPNGGPAEDADILKGMKLTYYFLEHWAFTHHTKGLPAARVSLQTRMLHDLTPADQEHDDEIEKTV